MQPYAVACGDVSQEHLCILNDVRGSLDAVPDGTDCHEVCRRLADAYALAHVRGRFNGAEHSWLMLSERVLLDPYPWASASGPLLVVADSPMWKGLYVPDSHARCPVCNRPCTVEHADWGLYRVLCPSCGEYGMRADSLTIQDRERLKL